MGRLIDANELKDFFFSETSGTEEIIHDLMQKHGLNYANSVNEDAVMYFAIDLLKGAQNVIDTQPIAYDPDKVVEQLEEFEKIMTSPVNIDCFGEECKASDCTVCLISKAIQIVKGGGVADPCAECIEAGGCPIREDCPNEGKKKSKSDMIVEQLEILKQKNPFIHGEKDNSLEASVSRQTLDYAIQVITKGGGADEY